MDMDDSQSYASSTESRTSVDEDLKCESPQPHKPGSPSLSPSPLPAKKKSTFFIDDILSDDFTAKTASAAAIVRPWDLPQTERTATNKPTEKSKAKSSPLDALLKMANKTFEGLEKSEKRSGHLSPHTVSSNGSSNNNTKKKRKSRTAFTNHQVFQLERRFLCQKYLSPADRDEIAQSLGLSNAQVITWFQNRRAKMKRDLEELKKDVTATRMHTLQKTLCFSDMDILRAKYLDYKRLN